MKFILRNEMIRDNAIATIQSLPLEPLQVITIEDWHSPRSLEQNAFLHAVPLKLICEHTGFNMDEMKDYLLGEAFGWEEVELFGRTIQRPLRRSSKLNVKEFTWFLEWIEQWASNTLGLLIPRPNEY